MFWFSRLSFSNSILYLRFEAHFSFCWCFIYQLLYTQWTSLLFICFRMSFMWTAFLFTWSLSFSLHHWTFLFTVSMSLLLKFHLTLDFVQLHGCIQLHVQCDVVGCKRYLAHHVIYIYSATCQSLFSIWTFLFCMSSCFAFKFISLTDHTHTHTHKSHEDSVHLFIPHWSLKLTCSFPSLVQQLHCHDQ